MFIYLFRHLNHNMNINVKCQYCKSERVVKRGLSPTANRGKQQRYLCRDCDKTFIQDLGFWKMKNSEKIITRSIDAYFSNLSSRKMRDHLARHDETEIDRRKNKDIFWCSVDWGSRYINATLYSPLSQNMGDAKEFMQRMKKSGIPAYIQTDGLPQYPRAFRKTFGQGNRTIITEHRVNNVSKSKKHNVRIETVFSKIKDRVQDFRGLKALWSAPILLAGIVLQHNFIQNHTTTKKLPCELAGIKISTEPNRWLEMIKVSYAH